MDRNEKTSSRCPDRSEASGRSFTLGRGDLGTLKRLAESLLGREEAIAARWTDGYRLAFGKLGYYAPADFHDVALDEIRTVFQRLLEEDRDDLAAWFARRGQRLFRAGVPFSEICRSLHLFETSVLAELRLLGHAPEEMLGLYEALDHLSHERLILLVESFHQGCKWRWMERTEGVIAEVARREKDGPRRDRLCALVGASDSMQMLYERLLLAAQSRDAVLVAGETGTGKELAACTIHAVSGDAPDRFVALNCAAIPADLVESELFGHRRGAFSGAREDHLGLFRAADGGTLFLDEVTELPPLTQAKLLRALQERAVRPVGGLAEIRVSVRIIASTNRPLEQALDEGRLRRDLYYRLRQMVVALPPLREKAEDLPLLVSHFAMRAAADGACQRAPEFDDGALARLRAHDWPGNVRELESVVRLLCRTAGRGPVMAHHVTSDLLGGLARTGLPHAMPAPADSPVSLKEAERDAIVRALESTEGNKTHAAKLLGISRKQLYVKLRSYGI